MRRLILSTLQTMIFGGVVLGPILFVPGGTLAYWQGWVFLVVFAVSTNAIGVYLALNDPVLLERRKKVGPMQETSFAQKVIATLFIEVSLDVLVFSALDHRFAWFSVPALLSVAGDGLVALGLFITLIVLRENSFSASTVQTYDQQQVISTGPYALVRQPMYVGAMIMLFGVPPALGSWWGLVFVPVMLVVLRWRILDEETLLKRDLSGYVEYTRRVRFRIVPHLW